MKRSIYVALLLSLSLPAIAQAQSSAEREILTLVHEQRLDANTNDTDRFLSTSPHAGWRVTYAHESWPRVSSSKSVRGRACCSTTGKQSQNLTSPTRLQLWRFGRFYRLCRFLQSTTYALSTPLASSNPSFRTNPPPMLTAGQSH